MISEPQNPLAVHLGGGVVQICTDPPETGTLAKYEIQCSDSLEGPYQFFSNRFFDRNNSFIYDFVVGMNAYIQIRAIATDGSMSDWVQVRRGKAVKPLVSMLCRSHEGSVIPKGALFTAKLPPDRIIGFLAEEDILFEQEET